MRLLITTIIISLSLACSTAQDRKVGGPCEGCEALFEYGNQQLNAVDTLPGFVAADQKLKITGTVFREDGKSLAKNVIIYVYHTNQKGVYPKKGNENGWARRHGYIRGWVKTDNKGRYTFYTFRPASYPNSTVAQHIHMTIKEPNTIPYYIDEIQFADDPHFKNRNSNSMRGGSGLVNLQTKNNLMVGVRDITLGKNIPNY